MTSANQEGYWPVQRWLIASAFMALTWVLVACGGGGDSGTTSSGGTGGGTTVGGTTGGGTNPQPTELPLAVVHYQRDLLRLLYEAADATSLSLKLVEVSSPNRTLLPLSSVCGFGGDYSVNQNGAPVSVGAAVQSYMGFFVMNFACRKQATILNGALTLNQEAITSASYRGTQKTTNFFKLGTTDGEGFYTSGQIDYVLTQAGQTSTVIANPVSGLTVRDSASQAIAAVDSGRVTTTIVHAGDGSVVSRTMKLENLSFTKDGLTFVGSGEITFRAASQNGGVLELKNSDGVPVGRIVGSPSGFLLTIQPSGTTGTYLILPLD